MLIENIILRDFRNYEYANLSPDKGINIIYGKNGQGKTNILESVFLCSTARSHRTSKDIDLIKTDKNEYSVHLEGKRDNQPFDIDINCIKQTSRTVKRTISVNGSTLSKTGQLMGVLNSVMFSPEDLYIVKEGPSERRRFLDILLSQTNPVYFYTLQEYIKITKQKNAILKAIKERGINIDLLDVFNMKQAKAGYYIVKQRKDIIENINKTININNSSISQQENELGVSYVYDFDEFFESEQEFYNILDKNKNKEIKAQASLYGPHRDDMDILLDNMNIREYGSQGQQRTAMLSLKFSEMQIIKQKTGKNPVLLLDDALSELDLSRKRGLLEKIGTNQTFITCTEKRKYMSLSNKTVFFRVDGGKIKSV